MRLRTPPRAPRRGRERRLRARRVRRETTTQQAAPATTDAGMTGMSDGWTWLRPRRRARRPTSGSRSTPSSASTRCSRSPPPRRAWTATRTSRPPPARSRPTASSSPRRSAPSTATRPRSSSSTAPASGATTSATSSTTPSAWPQRTRPRSRRRSRTSPATPGRFSGFLAEATGLPQDVLQESLTMHVMQLKGQLDAYAKSDYAKAYDLTREAYAHMYDEGDALAAAIAEQSPDMFPLEPATATASDLRVTLDRLFGEHAILAMLATQKGLAGDPDFEAIAGALDANSVDISRGDRLRLRRRGGQDVPRRAQPVARPHRVLRGLHGRTREGRQGGPGRGGRQPDRLHRRVLRLPRRGDRAPPGRPAGGGDRARHAAEGRARRLLRRRLRPGLHALPRGLQAHDRDRRHARPGIAQQNPDMFAR